MSGKKTTKKQKKTEESLGKPIRTRIEVHNGEPVVPLSGGMNAPRLTPTSAEWDPHLKRFDSTSAPLPGQGELDGNRESLIRDPETLSGIVNKKKK